jgi:hypothetical protein
LRNGLTVIDPDAEVAAAVADIFAAFTATGSAYGVVAVFKDDMRSASAAVA